MKLGCKLILASWIFLPAISFGSFSLEAINSIECSDLAVAGDSNVYFTTESDAARKYFRKKNTIPYDYGNLVSNGAFQSGQMTLNNNPDRDGGVISLVDLWDPNNLSELVLKPAGQVGKYLGALSGQIEIMGTWHKLSHRAMNCVVR